MGKKRKTPSTNALRWLRSQKVDLEVVDYPYVSRGGTAASAAALGVEEHRIVKTLVFEDDQRRPFLILMHGDRSVSTKALARELGLRSCGPCDPAVANRHTGYQVGGTSPFGTRKAMPVYAEATILELPRMWINAGARGWLVALSPDVLKKLNTTAVNVAR